MQAPPGEIVERLQQRLRAGANAGGWPYYAGKESRVEPTCWALLALHAASEGRAETARLLVPHVAYLATLQNEDGLLVETDPVLANVTANAMALIALRGLGGDLAAGTAARLQAAMVALKGVRLNEPDPKQDNTLQGWPWVRDTFSWVEPTSWALLALKVAGRGAAAAVGAPRQNEAELLLLNRMCVGGGWNYGNASTLGQDLRPYAPTTAIALLALQNRRSLPAVQQSLRVLEEHQTAERGTMSLALVSTCLKLFGMSSESVDGQLATATERSEASGNLLTLAMALFALTFDRHGGDLLRVG